MKSNTTLELYNLIHSLTPTEKSYFKKGLSKRSDGKLGELFALFNKKKSYDEEQLLGEIKSQYVNPSDVCLKLINAILRSMARYRADSSVQSELNTLLTQIEFLHKRRLYLTGERLIKKGLKLAKQENQFTYINILSDKLIDFIPKRGNDKLKNIKQVEAEFKKATEHQIMHQNLRILYSLMLDHFTNSKPSRKGLKQFMSDILQSHLMVNPEQIGKEYKALRVYAQNNRNGALFYSGDWETALAESKSLIEYLGPPEKLSERLSKSWLSINFNMITIACFLLDKKSYTQIRAQVDEMVSKKENAKAILAQLSFKLLSTHHLINSGKLDEALATLTTQVKQLHNPEVTRSQDKSNLRLAIGMVLFYQEKYPQAIAEINKVLVDDSVARSEDLIYKARWIEILSVYNLGDHTLFESKLLAMYRYIKQKNSGFDWQTDLLNTLKKTVDEPVKKRSSAFSELHQKVKKHELEFRTMAHGFNLLHFIEASTQGLPMNKFMAKRYLGS